MAYEITQDDNLNWMVVDKDFDIVLKRTMPGMATLVDVYTFTYASKSVQFSVQRKDGHYHVHNITKLEGISPEVFKECFEFLFAHKSKKSNAQFKLSYSLE